MPFRYLRDTLFLSCFALYWLNQYFLQTHVQDVFFQEHLSMLLCVPILTPIFVGVARMIGMRPDDRPPQINEILLPLLVWSITLQLVLPRLHGWSEFVIHNGQDVAWYCVGAVFSSIWWWLAYSPAKPAKEPEPATGWKPVD